MWVAQREKSTLPNVGGWLDQPLELLVAFRMMSYIEWLWKAYRDKGVGHPDFVRSDLEMVVEVEKWLDEE